MIKIEFYNPGKLPDDITVDDLLKNAYRSTPRNKLIADCCKDMGIIEKYGSGIRRIVNYFKEENLPLPDFRNISDGFMVTVYAKSDEEKGSDVIENVIEKRERNILDLIAKDKNIAALQIAQALSVTERTIHRDLEKLKSRGLLRRVGPDKGGYWVIEKLKDKIIITAKNIYLI